MDIVTERLIKGIVRLKSEVNKRAILFNGLSLVVITLGVVTIYLLIVPSTDWVAGNLFTDSSVPLLQRTVLEQPFISNKDNLFAVRVKFIKGAKAYPDDAILYWKLLSPENAETLVAKGNIPLNALVSDKTYTIKFPPIEDSFFHRYIFQVRNRSGLDKISVISSANSQTRNLSYELNGKKSTGTLFFVTGYAAPKVNAELIIRCLLISIPIWLLFVFRKRWLPILDRIPLHWAVTGVLVLFGLCMLVLQPPVHMYDELEHFRRVWEVSTGKLSPTATDGVFSTRLPEYIQQTLDRIVLIYPGESTQNPTQLLQMLLEIPGDEAIRTEKAVLTTTYSFFPYLVPAAFVRIGILLKSSALGLIYIARLAVLLQFSLLVFFALKWANIGKYTLAVIILLGLVVTQGVAINVDYMMLGGSFLFFATIFNLIWPQDPAAKITGREILLLLIGTFCILVSKHVYLPIVALVILIPTTKFASIRQKWMWILIYLFLIGILAVFFQYLTMPGRDPRIDAPQDVSLVDQIDFLLQDPFNWPRVYFQTLLENGFSLYSQVMILNVAQNLGLLGLFQFICVLWFAWSASEPQREKVPGSHLVVILLILVLSTMFVMLPLYLVWSQVGSPTVNGLQGRYFIPVIALALIAFRPRVVYTGTFKPASLVLTMSFLLLFQSWMVLRFFY